MFVRNPRLSKSAQNTAPASKNQGSGPPGKQKNLMNCSGNQLKKQVLLKCASADHPFPILQTFLGHRGALPAHFRCFGCLLGALLERVRMAFFGFGRTARSSGTPSGPRKASRDDFGVFFKGWEQFSDDFWDGFLASPQDCQDWI